MKSMTWVPSMLNSLEIVKAENSGVKYTLIREESKLCCPCGFIEQ